MKKVFSVITVLLFLFFCNSLPTQAQKHQLVKLWETDSVFKVPESVLFDEKNNTLYVANIDGTDPWGRDGKGSVGKMGADGKVIAAEWVTGINAPKGMGLYKGKLYVADLTELVVIDIATGSITGRIPVTGAEGLNDVCIDKKGVIYVSDSKLKKVFRVDDGRSEVYLENLKGPNGVLVSDGDLYLLDAGSMNKVNKDKSLARIADGMEGGTDGIENIGGNDFIVSCWAGALWCVNTDGTKELLKDTRAQKGNTADIGYDAKTKTVFVPTFWNNTVIAYQVK
jgi:DNA-binding beta-propeller fold protein YncE